MDTLLHILHSTVTRVYSLHRLVSLPDPSFVFQCVKLRLISFIPIPCLQIARFKNRPAQLCKDETPKIIRVGQLRLR